jgi:hypothetical protein
MEKASGPGRQSVADILRKMQEVTCNVGKSRCWLGYCALFSAENEKIP